jgi:hypothetical protein
MPNITKGAVKRRGVQVITTGKKGGHIVKRYGAHGLSEKKLKHTFENRENRLVPPPPTAASKHSSASQSQWQQEPDLNYYFVEEEVSIEHTPTGEFDGNGNRPHKRRRNKASKRKSVAENWVAAERRLVRMSMTNGEIPPCECVAREMILVKHISCEGRSHLWDVIFLC